MEKKIEHHDSPMPSGIGARLKAAREAAGLGLGEVADRLKLSLRQLEAIERDDFDALPGATFVRGFVRNYARFLEVDSEPLMQALEQHFPSAVNEVANLVKGTAAREAAHVPEEPEPESSGGGGAGKWLALVVVVAALVGASVWYANRDSDSAAKPADSADSQLAPMLTQQHEASAAAANKVAQAASAPSAAAASAPAKLAKPQASAPPAVAKAAVKPVASAVVAKAAKPAASAPQAEGTDRVSVNVKDAAWVSVQDANGRRLIYQVMQPGSPSEVTGLAPFKVVVGNASQVELNYNGKPVDLSGKIRGTTAKIQLK
ncbi:helix-turn-helix domain-containing protein [Chromobacterium sphagni]|uniref:HTH cro/C1-type domain-containing protein n=1 Tax=Chromobacterium sphagni TaxID=1903179 RepID=A0ABX3CAR3_9NEIS|nr:RodZ domain-containing protein [Chromobacterium sphagni]OHX19375.1 hypothetical protein BI344_09700 [Chromobacterium sphagni]